jgi:hypothetical protein
MRKILKEGNFSFLMTIKFFEIIGHLAHYQTNREKKKEKNLSSDCVRDKPLDQILDVAGGNFVLDNFEHLLANLTDLRRLSVASLLLLVLPPLGESQTVNSQ